MADRLMLRGALLVAAAALICPGSLIAAPRSAGAPAVVKPGQSSSASKRAYPMPGKPGGCKSDADCGPGFACFHGGRCLCKPGRRLCRTTCADLESDANNCGACGHACASGDGCIEGICRAPGAVSQLTLSPQVSYAAFTISNADGTSVCLHDSQAAPERAAVAGDSRLFVTYGTDESNVANLYETWGTSKHDTPGATNSWTTTLYGEPSATTSDFTGLDYLGFAGERSGTSNKCVAIAAATSDGLVSNTFMYDHGAACATSGFLGVTLDTPTITYDRGGTDLWAAFDTSRGSGDDVEEIMEDCDPGQPGCCTNDANHDCTPSCSHDADHPCPVTSYIPEAATGVHDVPDIAVNPCTHNGIMLYATTDNQIRIHVVEPDGTLVRDFEIAGSKSHNGNDVCCNGQVRTCSDGSHYCDSNVCSPEPCRRLPAHPEIAISEVSGTCYAYIAYDQSAAANDGGTYFNARLGVWDVTDDSNPVWKKGWVSKNLSSAYNTYGHEVAAAGPYVAWGFYTDYYGPCSTYFSAYVDKNSMLSSLGTYVFLSNAFPNMRIYGHPSDWVRAISRGVGQGGQLLLTWERPRCMNTGSSCDTCGGPNHEIDGCYSGQWSHVVKGAVITP